MQNDLEINVDFMINSPDAKRALNEVKNEINGVANQADTAGKRLNENINNIIDPNKSKGLINDLKSKIAEAKKVAESATSELSIELANAKIQQYEKQLQRLAVIGKQGFDDMGNQIADAVDKPTGRIEKLQYLISKYSDFVKTSDNEEQIKKYNGKIQEAQNEVQRLSNVGKEGFDELGNKIEQSGGALGKFYETLTTIANIIPGLGIAGLIGIFIEPLMDYIKELGILEDKLRDSEVAAKGLSSAMSAGSEYAEATAKISELKVQVVLAAKGMADKKAVIDSYNESIGAVSGQVKTLNEVENGLIKNTPNYLKMILLRATAQNLLQEAAQKNVDALKKRNMEDVSLPEKILFNAKIQFGSSISDALESFKEKREKDAKELEKDANRYNSIANKYYEDAAKLAKGLGGNINSSLNNKVIDNKYIDEAESLQRRIYEIQQEYTRKRMSKDDEELQAVRDKFAKLAEEVTKFNKNPKNKIKVDGSSLDATRDKAIEDLTFKQNTEKLKIELERQKTLYQEYEAYKKDFGEKAANERYAKELAINKTYIDLVQSEYEKLSTKQAETLTGGEKERLDYLKKTLDVAKKEKQKSDDEQYKQALEAAQTYTDKLVNIEKDYQAKLKALRDNGGLTSERLKVLEDEKNRSIESAKDEALQKLAIYKQLSEDAVEITKKQIQLQIDVIRDLLGNNTNLPLEIRNKLEAQLAGLEMKLQVSVEQTSLDGLKTQYRDLSLLIGQTDEFGQSLLSEKERVRIVKALTDIKAKMKEVDATGDGKVTWADKIAKNFAYLQGNTEEVARGLAKDLGTVASSFQNLSREVSQYDTELGKSLNDLGKLINIGSAAAQSVAGFASGDIMSGVSGAVQAISGLVSWVAEAEAAYKRFYDNIVEGERKYQEALYARQLLEARANTVEYLSLSKQYTLLTSQAKAYADEYKKIYNSLQSGVYIMDVIKEKAFWITVATHNLYDTLAGKSFEQLKQFLLEGRLEGEYKKMVERLVELEQKGFDAQQELDKLGQQLAELFTGTTASSLADSLLEMFKAGKTGVQDLADFFQETMQNAALSIFKNKILAEAMDKFYQEFSKATMDGGLDQSKIANLKLLFDSLVQGANTQFNALQQVTGLNLVSGAGTTGSNSNSLSGQIQRNITEATASELAGLARSYYDISKKNYGVGVDSLAVIRQNATYLLAIQNNTAKTVEKLEDVVTELKTVSKNTKASNSAYDNGW